MHATTSTILILIMGLILKHCCTSYGIFNNFQKDKPDPKPLVVKEIPSM